MHGVKRIRYSREALEAKQQRDKAKLQEYLALTEEIISRKKNGDYSHEAFDLTTRMLRVNPEFYTVWNYRKTILVKEFFLKSTPHQINDVLSGDLDMTTAFLKQHPKIYAIWNHRRWCLEQVPEGPTEADPNGWKMANWKKELYVVEKMLDVDARNFHAWNYRRYVLASMPVHRSEQSELDYTTRKIEANFSNFSAWHQRSKVLTTLWETGKANPAQNREEELELVRNAMYTDPFDQSVWIYHRWLIGEGSDATILQAEISSIQELLDEQPDSKWCMESLVHYKQLLLRNHSAIIGAEDRQVVKTSCLDLLLQLQHVDSERKNRYGDLAVRIRDMDI
ncbi:rab-protein geranylgeranyltransferase [Irpex rosettiformis]|uniref:Rab-protein geranylgeranyltransferase n=1 Tax=Irpex rosettiformis TaxID=378272 RepID=A0ACB8UI00_9APHY|nr:rab-protein geranylgeranyltransferase [Irpex rosettiformis]